MVSRFALLIFTGAIKEPWKGFVLGFNLLAFLYTVSYIFLKIKIVFLTTAKLISSLFLTIEEEPLWECGEMGAILFFLHHILAFL